MSRINSLDVILLGLVGAAMGHFVAAKEDFWPGLIGGMHRCRFHYEICP